MTDADDLTSREAAAAAVEAFNSAYPVGAQVRHNASNRAMTVEESARVTAVSTAVVQLSGFDGEVDLGEVRPAPEVTP